MKKLVSICTVDITKETGRTAHAIVLFPGAMRKSAQMNMLLLQHDTAAALFAHKAPKAVQAYYEVNQ